MRLSFGLEQKLVQKQILAPRMIQSMEILQLPVLALEERIEQEMNENPMLETQERDPDVPDEAGERENPDALTENEKELVVDENKDNEADFERLVEMDQEFPDAFDDGPRRSVNRMEEIASRKHDAMANIAARAETLQHYLEMQLGEMELDDDLLEMAERIVTSLDSNGYLATSLEDLLPPDADEATLALARRALEVVQSLDPPGVGARDLRECLLLQLRPEMPFYDEVKTLVSGHLEDLRDNRLPAIQRRTGYTIPRIQAAWDQLRKLNPKPGADFTASVAPTVTPDIFLEQQDDGSYRVIVEEGRIPSLRISNYYRKRLMSGDATRRRTRIHQTQDQCRPMADRIDPAATQHADPRRPGHRRSSDALSGRRPGVVGTAEDAADRRQGGRARDHGQPGRRRQMDSDASRYLPAETLLCRRDQERRRRGRGLGLPFA